MKRLIVCLLPLLFLAGCPSNPQTPMTYADSLALANVSLTAVAEATRAACGNIEPGAPCQSGSPLDREDVDRIKQQLLYAARLVDAAGVADASHDGLTALSEAQRVIGELRQILVEKGVQVE